MTTVYSYCVHRHIKADGQLLVTEFEGELTDAGGRPVVLSKNGHVFAADEFHPTRAAAMLTAAAAAEQLGRRILDQAEQIRQEVTT